MPYEFFVDDTNYIMGNSDFGYLDDIGWNGAIYFSVPLQNLCLPVYLVLPGQNYRYYTIAY